MGRPIHVLCVFSRLDRGGAESMCMNLYRNIDRSKIQFDFVKHTHSIGSFEEEIKALGGQIYEAPQYRVYNHFQYCAWWKKHLAAHPEHQIIHGHYFTISPIYFKIARQFQRITVGHSHSTAPQTIHWYTRIKLEILKSIEHYADYCLACSQDAGKWLFPHKEFTILNNAIDPEKFQYSPSERAEARKDLGLNDCLTVGIVGSLIEVKNPFETIAIFKAVHNKMPSAKLLWVGGGRLEQDIRNKLQEEHLTNAVIMTGVRPDVNRLLQAMDVFIFPSFAEGLGMAAIEAQAAGLPCFCSEAVPTEAAITSLCSFLPLNHPELWAEKIIETDLSIRRNTSEQVKAAGYDIHTTAKWLEDFYLSISKS